jgi:sulfite reductase alpha subunit-like flavoprotein
MTAAKQFYILYGSQTGNSECIAQKFHEHCVTLDLPSTCMHLNAAKSLTGSLASDALAMIVVCSTTGNGDCPENAEAWWRSVKLRSMVCIMDDV